MSRDATSLNGLLCLQIWQPIHATAIADFALAAGLNAVMLKALDGDNWMGAFDSTGIAGVEHVQQFADYFHERGLRFGIWTIPKVEDQSGEADLTIMAAGAGAEFLALDIEPYQGFWGTTAEPGEAQALAERLDREVSIPIILQPDPRPNAERLERIEEWAVCAAAIAGQDYWTSFQKPWQDSLYNLDLADRLGLSTLPTLPGDAEPADMQAAAAGCRRRGALGLFIWRYGSCSPETAAAAVQGFLYGNGG